MFEDFLERDAVRARGWCARGGVMRVCMGWARVFVRAARERKGGGREREGGGQCAVCARGAGPRESPP